MTHEIANAIRSRSLLKIWYEPGERIVEPHALGWSSKGDALLRVYQASGATSSGQDEGWKLLRIDGMPDGIGGIGSFYGPRPGYRRGDKAMKGGIIAEL